MALSLKWQIQVWHAFILLVVLAVLGVGFYQYEKAQRIAAVDEQLNNLVPSLLGPRGPSGPGYQRKRHTNKGVARPEEKPTQEMPVPETWQRRDPGGEFLFEALPSGFQRRITATDEVFNTYFTPLGFYLYIEFFNGNRPKFVSEAFPDIEIPNGLRLGELSRTRGDRYREFFVHTPEFRVLLGYDLKYLQAGLDRLKLQIAGGLTLVFGLALLVGYLFVSRAVRPLRDITITTHKIASSQLDSRVPATRRSDARELQTLTADLNTAFAQLEASFKRQIRFTADASHELRTPLTALLAQLDLGLRQRRKTEEYEHILNICKRSGGRIRRITEQLIELSRYDSGNIEMAFETIDLQTMLTSLAEELEPYVEAQGSQLETDIQPGLVRCDPFRVEQVLTNLINNALQHNAPGITITLRGIVESKSFSIEVMDTGKGIIPENIDRLFDRFFQEDPSRSKAKKESNVGLGLSISEAIIHAHGGTIAVTSKSHIETVFRIQIPKDLKKVDPSL